MTFEDCTRHIDWSLAVGRRRTRQTARQAASTMRELPPHGIRVNAVAPQPLDPPLTGATFPAEVMAHAVAPEAIADVTAFLGSDAAAPVRRVEAARRGPLISEMGKPRWRLPTTCDPS